MEIKGLEIGNYVQVDNPEFHPELVNKYFKVTSITETENNEYSIGLEVLYPKVEKFQERYHQLNKFIKPIPLTEAWLLKFKFEETEFVFRLGSFFLTKSRTGNKFLYQAHTDRFSVKYVHKLQNLYFALKEKEL